MGNWNCFSPCRDLRVTPATCRVVRIKSASATTINILKMIQNLHATLRLNQLQNRIGTIVNSLVKREPVVIAGECTTDKEKPISKRKGSR